MEVINKTKHTKKRRSRPSENSKDENSIESAGSIQIKRIKRNLSRKSSISCHSSEVFIDLTAIKSKQLDEDSKLKIVSVLQSSEIKSTSKCLEEVKEVIVIDDDEVSDDWFGISNQALQQIINDRKSSSNDQQTVEIEID